MRYFEIICLSILLFVSGYLRFTQLGYSDFYGDETKTLYFRKDVSASNFLLNQRKGPVQFVSSWVVEKVTGGFNEANIRFPFALAGLLSVVAVYILVRLLFGFKSALISTALFSLNGFMIAFSRTAQYQSFLILFGLLSIIFAYLFFKELVLKNRLSLFLSAFFLGLAFLSHYDAVFFGLVTIFILAQKVISDKSVFKSVILFFVLPFVLIISTFYIPYITSGYFQKNTINYINKRVSGKEYKPNNSYNTYKIYNPSYGSPIILFFGLLSFIFLKSWKRYMLLVWFGVPFLLFEIVFSNPGTHILNYVIPLIIFSGVFLNELIRFLGSRVKVFHGYLVIFIFILVVAVSQAQVFVPFLNDGYPWIGNKVNNKYNLFLYGFSYNRGWRQVRGYFLQNGMPRSFYTNDNITIGEWYLRGIPSKIITDSQFPEVYISVNNNHEYRIEDKEVLGRYEIIKDFGSSKNVSKTFIMKYRPVK